MSRQIENKAPTRAPSQHSVAAAMFFIMALFGCIAAAYETLYLVRSGTWNGVIGVSLAIIMISLGGLVVMRHLTEKQFIRLFELAILYLESPLLLIGIAYNFFLAPEPLPALHYAIWIIVPFICAVATRPLRWAQIFGWLLFGGETVIFLAWLVAGRIDPSMDPLAASFIILLLCQAASLALLTVLSAYRERDAQYRARIAALEETSVAMGRAAAEAREAQQATEAALIRADRAMRAHDRFFATMSHELRTPLNAIIGFSDILGRELFGKHTEPRYREYALDIKSSGDHLLGIINELLDLSRLESGEASLRLSRVDLVDVVSGVVRLMTIQAQRGEVALVFEKSGGEPCWVTADEQALRQVAMNIIANAIKFTPPGGVVRLGVGGDGLGRCCLTVRDSGPGIPADKLGDIFKPFHRLDQDASIAVPGTGLGLAIVQALVTALGGAVDVESVLGHGATFTVTLPAAEEEAAGDASIRYGAGF